jgi:hypothetical protein
MINHFSTYAYSVKVTLPYYRGARPNASNDKTTFLNSAQFFAAFVADTQIRTQRWYFVKTVCFLNMENVFHQ